MRWVQAQREWIALHVTMRLRKKTCGEESSGIIYVQYNTMSLVYWKFTKQRNLPWVGWAHPCCRCDPGSLPMIYWLNCGCSVGRQSTRKKTVQTRSKLHKQAKGRLQSRATSCSLHPRSNERNWKSPVSELRAIREKTKVFRQHFAECAWWNPCFYNSIIITVFLKQQKTLFWLITVNLHGGAN